MQGDRPQQGYDLLTQLRRLETRIARLQKRWRTFRADPRPDRLEEFRRSFADTDSALARLAEQLGEGETTQAQTREVPLAEPAEGDPRRSGARAVVEAGRTLDRSLGEIHRAWGLLRRDPDPDGLSGLADRLARAESAAAVLGRALPGEAAAGWPGEGREADDGGASDPARPERVASGSLDGLLTRIRSDWENLRREPAPDRAGMLRSELAEARRLAEALRARLERDGPTDADTARYLTGMRDAVRFAPYRDAFTGLYNREGFDALAGAELKRCRRYSRSFGLILLETRLHDLGELRNAIGTLQALLRGYDLVSRYSDRRLAIGLPETDGPETRRIAARLLRAREEEGSRPVRRLGYALLPDDGATLAALLEQAERGLEA